MSQPIYQVDAFTDRAFAGNPAAVCLLERARDARWMQNVAMEMNLAETAFLVPREDRSFDLRWFTPTIEVDLCGHATLASAHLLWEIKRLKPDEPARFHTRSGLLTCVAGDDGWIQMDFPATPPQPTSEDLDVKLGLHGQTLQEFRTRFDLMIEIKSAQVLREMLPDLEAIRALRCRGVIVTARDDSGEFDFISRFFAPQSGMDEDPVTGSSHCALGPHWSVKLGKTDLVGYQASKRGGVVRVKLTGDRVLLFGQAITTLRAELLF